MDLKAGSPGHGFGPGGHAGLWVGFRVGLISRLHIRREWSSSFGSSLVAPWGEGLTGGPCSTRAVWGGLNWIGHSGGSWEGPRVSFWGRGLESGSSVTGGAAEKACVFTRVLGHTSAKSTSSVSHSK